MQKKNKGRKMAGATMHTKLNAVSDKYGPIAYEYNNPKVINNCMSDPRDPLTESSAISPTYMGKTVITPPTAKPHRNLTKKNKFAFVAKPATAKATIKGTTETSKVFFRPILSTYMPAASGPKIAPTGNKDPIHDSSARDRGVCRGLLSGSTRPFSLGIIGEVQPNAVPHVNAARFPKTINVVLTNNSQQAVRAIR